MCKLCRDRREEANAANQQAATTATRQQAVIQASIPSATNIIQPGMATNLQVQPIQPVFNTVQPVQPSIPYPAPQMLTPRQAAIPQVHPGLIYQPGYPPRM